PLVPLVGGQGLSRLNWRIALAAILCLALLIGGALAMKGLDAAVLTEATKSLGYRLQYWRSTLAMIARHPLLGVGPGNFQDYYTQFKLPEASEEIRDPHNFLLEVWATAGTLALTALCAALALFAWRTGSTPPRSWGGETGAAPEQSTRDAKFLVAGAA